MPGSQLITRLAAGCSAIVGGGVRTAGAANETVAWMGTSCPLSIVEPGARGAVVPSANGETK